MSKKTMFHTRFWEDNYVSDLDPIEKLLFIYALTNPRVSLCGIYEVAPKSVALDTGIDKEMLPKIFRRFEKDKKVVYLDGWMCVVNYPKYQNYNKTTMATALEREISLIPKKILDSFIGYGYPIHNLSIGYRDKEQDKDKEREQEYSRDFLDFWAKFPRKIGKGAAWIAWKRAKPPLAKVLVAIEAQKDSPQWRKNGGQFIPHPTTWLNQRRWEDELGEEVKSNVDRF